MPLTRRDLKSSRDENENSLSHHNFYHNNNDKIKDSMSSKNENENENIKKTCMKNEKLSLNISQKNFQVEHDNYFNSCGRKKVAYLPGR